MKGMLLKKEIIFFVPSLRYTGPWSLEPAVMSVIWLKGLHSAHPTLSDVDTLFIR